MGSYITSADLATRLESAVLIALTDDANEGEVNAAVEEQAIAEAEGEFNSYASARYGIPVSPVEAMVKKICLDLAVKNLYARRGRIPEDVRADHKEAVDWLSKLATGKVVLAAAENASPDERVTGAGVVAGGERLFTRETLKDS